jgi:hypothetical protein
LSSVVRYRFVNPTHREYDLTVQYNPKRAERHKGAGSRKEPPLFSKKENNACFLCKQNIEWQQSGIEIGYDLRINEREYIAWMNPFPLMQTHTTISRAEHVDQSWIGSDTKVSNENMRNILLDLLAITERLPEFVGFYNGDGAGATIPAHFHFQFFRRVAGQEAFALEKAARVAFAKQAGHTGAVVIRDYQDYPIVAICFEGRADFIVDCALKWVGKWTEFYNNSDSLSANIICTVESQNLELFHLYFVPRNKYVSHSAGRVGLVGGLEVFGEMVVETKQEHQLLQSGRVDYEFVARVINGVEAPGVYQYLDTVS